jgi:hypothetical protein
VYFVCRWREESPFGKRVVAVPDATVLDWFRRGWGRAEPEEWIESELGGDAYGLDSIFERARERRLPQPDTVERLRELLHEHLWVEGDDKSDYIRLGEHALRVRTDDDEVDLAYYFVDDEAVAASPDRLAFLVHDTWPLPGGAAAPGSVFSQGAPVRTVRLGPPGPECVFSVRLCWESPDTGRNLDLAGAVTFPGLTLPDLVAKLRGTTGTESDRWPHDVRLLRELTAPEDDDPGPALRRYARLAGYDLSEHRPRSAAPGRSLVRVEPHIAQVARHIDDFFGYDQWFLFDSRWAAAHPDLARSLLRYAAHWDPYEG